MVARVAATTVELSAWATAAPRTLAELEQQALVAAQGLGNALLAGLCAGLAATPAARERPCACGHPARYCRQRPARVTTLLGPIAIARAYYTCTRCGHGHAPLDRQLGYRAGSTSAGLDELLALLGATADSFEAASTLLARLTLVHVCPNLARAATEALGQALQATEQRAVAAAWGPGTLPTAVAAPPRLCLSMDRGGGPSGRRVAGVHVGQRLYDRHPPFDDPPGRRGGVRAGGVLRRRCHRCRQLRATAVV